MLWWALKVISWFCVLALIRLLTEILMGITTGLRWLTLAVNGLVMKSLDLWDRAEEKFFRVAARWGN